MNSKRNPKDPTANNSSANGSDRLQREIDTQKVVLAELTAELENQRELNRFLEEDLRTTKEDLDYVERQFIILDERMQSSVTRASAVAAHAEAKLAYEKILREDPSAIQMTSLNQAKHKIDESNRMLQEKRHAAAIYFANRAMRLLTKTPCRKTILIVSAHKANIRTGPGTEFEVVGQLEFGAVLVQLDQKESWCLVETRNGREGWIHRSLIK